MRAPTHGSLFTGIGGFDLGFEWAGIKTIWQVEIDEYCRQLLELRFPGARRYADIRAFAVADAAQPGQQARGSDRLGNGERQESAAHPYCETPDIISGGFPCQPVSHAGKRQGAADDRYLWPEMFRVVRTLRPRWVVAENVYGLITHEGGTLLDNVYDDLEGEGYETLPPIILPACAFGAPHRRDRVWIVAHREHGWLSERRGTEAVVGNGGLARGIQGDVSPGMQQQAHDVVGNTLRGRCQEQWNAISERQARPGAERSDWWAVEPAVGRVAHGIPRRVDRLRGLGNAVIPKIAYLIGKIILASQEDQ